MRNLMKKLYKGISGMLITALLISAFSGMAFAGETKTQDPLAGRANGQISEGFYSWGGGAKLKSTSEFGTEWNGNMYCHNLSLRPYLETQPDKIKKGIDVSSYNGTVDWAKVKADDEGITFVVVRTGFRGWNDASLNTDANFVMNVRNAIEYGFDCGVYFFSQAITEDEAVEEANFVLKQLQEAGITPANLNCPVFLDVEYASENNAETGRLKDAGLSASAQTNICNAFIKTIENAGYKAGIYGNASMLKNQMYTSNIPSTAAIWMANYTNQSDYPYRYNYWQCSENGNVDGISGNVDLNFYYEPGNAFSEEAGDYWPRMTVSSVRLRKGPGTDYEEICMMPASAKLSVLALAKTSDGKEWYKVQYNSNTGYVSAAYTKPYTSEVSGLKMSGKSTSGIEISWEKAAYADGYVVYRAATKSGTYSAIKNISDQNTVTFADKDLKSGTSYYYKVKAYRKENNASYYGAESTVLTAATQVKKPTGFAQDRSKVSGSSITIKWNKVSGADEYQIYRSNAKNGTYKRVKTTSSGSTVKWTDKNVSSGTEYYYKIRAYDKVSGTGEFSSVVTMHTKMTSTLKIKTTKDVTMRKYAGTSYSKVVKIPKNKKFTVLYKTKDKSGKTWYKIKYTAKKKSYTGYVPASAVKKM